MKYVKSVILPVAILAALFMAAGCGNILNQQLDAESDGSVQLTLNVPNYQSHGDADSSRAISPDSRYIEIYFYNGALGTDRPAEADFGESLYWDDDTSSSNGFFFTEYGSEFYVPAGSYDHLEVVMYDEDPYMGTATELTTGSVSSVTVTGGTLNQFYVGLTPPSGMFTALTLGGAAVDGMVGGGSMVFYSFDATAGTSYDISIDYHSDPSFDFGNPDIYVFEPTGARPGTVLATADNGYVGDYLQTEGTPRTLTTYAAAQTGTYYIGIYGWIDDYNGHDGSSDFSISVAASASDVTRPTPGSPASGSVGWYVDEAVTALENQDYTGALSSFTEALLVTDAETDPEYGVAFAGYNALQLMMGMVDPAVVSIARNNLGMVDYPTDINELLSGEWLQEYVSSDGWTGLFPFITGQNDVDGDGFVDEYDRFFALAEYFVNHNAGFAELVNPALNVLEGRVESTLQQIRGMAPDQIFQVTWDMVYDDLDEIVTYFNSWDGYADYSWPVDGHGNPIDIIFGKAELQLIGAMGEMLKSYIHQAQVYELTLSQTLLQEYWATYNPETGTAYDSPPSFSGGSPFVTGFLSSTDDWVDQLQASEDAFLAALSDVEAAIYDIKGGRPSVAEPLFLSPRSTLDDIADMWPDIQSGMNLAVEEVIWRVEDSVENGTMMYFPLSLLSGDAMPDDYRFGNWPTDFDIQTDPTIGVNYGRFFSAPFSGLLELDTNGEPVWYHSTGSPGFTELTSLTDPASTTTFMKVPDITLGGLIPIDDALFVPMDDPATQYGFEMDFDDTNSNGFWDAGEYVYWVDIYPAIEGLINTDVMNVSVEYPGGDAVGYYGTEPTILDIPDQRLVDDGYVADLATAADLKSYIDTDPFVQVETWGANLFAGEPLFFLVGNSVYISVIGDIPFSSLNPQGTTGTGVWGDTITSTGSAWTAPAAYEFSGEW